MSYISDAILDDLSSIAGATVRIDICNADPGSNYTQATSTYTVGNATGQTMETIEAGGTDGRRVQSPALTGATVTSDAATASHWAISNGTDTVHASGALASSQTVYTANGFDLGQISITNRDATAEA